MEIFLPDDIKRFEPDLRFFFDMMVLKLRLNRSKGFAKNKLPIDMFNEASGEMNELRSALIRGSQEEVLAEAADVANMAWLTALCAIRMDKMDFNAQLVRGTPEAESGQEELTLLGES